MDGLTRQIVNGARMSTKWTPHIGKVFYCDSAGTLDNDFNAGPVYSTIAAALAKCRANRGDVIYLAPSHAETIVAAAGIDLSTAGVTVVGLGRGSTMATITLGTATTATFKISAANVMIANIKFSVNVDSLVKIIDVSANDAIIDGCILQAGTAKEFLSGINIATTYDNTIIRNTKFIQATDPAGTNAGANTGAIYLVDSENVLIEDCLFLGCFETAMIHNRTTAAANLWVRRCYGTGSTLTADSLIIVLPAGATGGMDRCSFVNPHETATTEATLTGSFPNGFWNFQSYFGNDGSGGQLALAIQAVAS